MCNITSGSSESLLVLQLPSCSSPLAAVACFAPETRAAKGMSTLAPLQCVTVTLLLRAAAGEFTCQVHSTEASLEDGAAASLAGDRFTYAQPREHIAESPTYPRCSSFFAVFFRTFLSDLPGGPSNANRNAIKINILFFANLLESQNPMSTSTSPIR
jgi:hypothetical protein